MEAAQLLAIVALPALYRGRNPAPSSASSAASHRNRLSFSPTAWSHHLQELKTGNELPSALYLTEGNKEEGRSYPFGETSTVG